MTKKNKKYSKSSKTKRMKNQKHKKSKGGGEYYTDVGDEDRDSVDAKLQTALANVGVSNAPDNNQPVWLGIGIGGILAVGGILFLVIKKR
jgi:hypothetical protein